MMIQPLQSSANVNAVSSGTTGKGVTGSTAVADADDGRNSLDYEDFLTLLVMQLKYQNPLEPLDNSAFVAQNAQFSTVEQLIAIRKSIESQEGANTAVTEAANASYATNMIGKLIAADVSDYNEQGEYIENHITGIVVEVTFLRQEGEISVRLDDDSAVYLKQIISIRNPDYAE